MSPADDDGDRRVRDLIRGRELVPRARLGERTLRRVGGRAWERPNVFVSAALFDRHGVGDPWAPGGGDDDPIRMGPVSLRLGEERRQPAPHLRPKQSKAKKQADPLSKWRQPARSSSPTPAPAPARPAAQRPAPSRSAQRPPSPPIAPNAPNAPAADSDVFVPTPDRVERGMFRNKVKRGLKVPIPVRPELRAAASPDPVVAKADERKASGPKPARPVRRPGPARPRTRAGRVVLRRDDTPMSLGGPEVVEEVAVVQADEAAPLAPLEVLDAETGLPEAAPSAAPPAIDRRPPGRPIGLDDLFGGMPEGRVRMRRRAPSPPAEPEDS